MDNGHFVLDDHFRKTGSRPWAPHAHWRWRDTDTHQLKRVLNTVLADLVAQAAAAKTERR
jgi:hypothetical protein